MTSITAVEAKIEITTYNADGVVVDRKLHTVMRLESKIPAEVRSWLLDQAAPEA